MEATERELFTWEKQIHELTEEELRAGLRQMAKKNQVVFAPIPPREFLARFMSLFKCQRCGACCTREMSQKPQGVGLSPGEIGRLAALKGMSSPQFQTRYCRLEPGHMDYPCAFYDTRGACTIYGQRPSTCRVFPLDGMESGGEVIIGVQMVCPGGLEAMMAIFLEHRRELLAVKGG